MLFYMRKKLQWRSFCCLLPDEILLKKQKNNNDLKSMIDSFETNNHLMILVEGKMRKISIMDWYF